MNRKTTRAIIVLCALFALLLVNGVFTLGSTRNNPSSAWVTQPGIADRTYFEDSVVLQVSTKDDAGNAISTTDEDGETSVHIWVNVGKIAKANTSEGYGVITARWKSNSDFSEYTSSNEYKINIKKGVDRSSDQYQYGWYDTKVTRIYTYCQIATKDILEINEVVFTNDDGVILPAKVVKANAWVTDSKAEMTDAEKLPKGHTALNIANEQASFHEFSSMAKKFNFTTGESAVVNTALTIFNTDGKYIDKTTGALGIELITVGLSAFGINTLGVRIIPYIFFVLTIGLLFAFGRRLFDDTDAGVIFAVLYALFGLGLSVGSLGSATHIAVFFAVLSVYCMYSFYKGVNRFIFTEEKKSFAFGRFSLWVPIILSALAFALAINVKTYALFALPAVIALFALGIIRTYKIYKHNLALASFEDEKINAAKQFNVNFTGAIVIFALSFMLVTYIMYVIFYGILGTIYISHYGVKNLFYAIVANLKGSLFVKEGEASTFYKWLIGGGGTVIYSGATAEGRSTDVYLAMNVAVQLISLCSLIFTTVVMCIGKFGKNCRTELKAAVKAVSPAYITIAAGWLFCWVMFAFVKGATVAEYTLASAFAVGFIVIAYKLLRVSDIRLFASKGNGIALSTFALCITLCLALIFFGIGYVMFVGIETSSVAANILYGWWLW